MSRHPVAYAIVNQRDSPRYPVTLRIHLAPLSILQLEDSDLDLELQQTCLRSAGIDFRTTRVKYRSDYLAAIKTQTFDVILADFYLPDYDGLKALAVAREKAPATPFIFVSGVLGEETAIESLRNGATDYVLKRRIDRLAPAVLRAIAEAREKAEHHRVESALSESENRFRNMADFAPVIIWTVEPDKNWSYCNKLWLEVTGLTIDQSSQLGWTRLVHPQDEVQVSETYNRAFDTCQEFTLRYRMRRRDGQYRWIVNRAVPRFGSNNVFAGFIGSCTDVTDLKNAEERLLNSAKLESLGMLAGGIAHDFNNLLTGILGHAHLAMDEMPPESIAVTHLNQVVSASETAGRLTRQMLAYAGKGRFILQQVDLSSAVRETLPLIETLLQHLMELKLELARNLPAIKADLGQIQQLVMNLVINAAEAAGVSGGVVMISTGVAELDDVTSSAMLPGFPVPPGRYTTLRVQDNGLGMNEDTKARIFDPFFSTKFVGRGLGLAAVSGIVRGHQGGLTLVSEPGKGSDFKIYLR